MYNVSDEFKSAIQSTSRLMSCKAYLNGVELSVDKILKLDIEDNINNGDYFTIGEVPSKLLTIEMLGVDVIEGAEIKPYYGVEVSPGEFEYIPCGVFYVDSFTTNKNKVTATCYDKMLRLDDEYIPSIAIPVTLSEIMNDVCRQKEIEFEGQLPSITVNKSIKGYSYREMIGFIASFCGGNAKFNRFGKLIIQQYVKSSKIVNADVCGKFEHKDIYTVSAIACKFGDVANTRGDSSANCVNFTNPFVDDTNIDSIFNRLNGLSFMASSFKYNGDPSIDSGDLITVNDIKGNSHTVLVSTQSFTFSGGLSSEVTSIGEGKGANAYKQYKFKNKRSITELNIELGLLQGIISEVEEKQEDTYSKTETETLIEAKAGEITNTVKKGFYTKEETDTQITNKGYVTSTEVQQKFDKFQVKITEALGYNMLLNSMFNTRDFTNWRVSSSDAGITQHAATQRYRARIKCIYGSNGGISQTVRIQKGYYYTVSTNVIVDTGVVAGLEVSYNRKYKGTRTNTSNYKNGVLTYTFQADEDTEANVLFYVDGKSYGNTGNGKNAYFYYTQMEEGQLATAYSPNPNEIYTTNAIFDKNGLRIDQTNVGTYTQMSTNGFFVKKNNGNPLFEASDRIVLYDGKGVFCVAIVNDPSASYGNARVDIRGGINFLHKPGVSVGTNQILLGNHDVNNQYGMHNLFIRCWNTLGFADNNNWTNMFADIRRGRWILKGAVYQNAQTPPRTFSMNFDGEDEVYASGFTRSQAIDSVMKLRTGVYVDNDGECCTSIYGGHDELITTKYQDEDGVTTTHINTNALNASLVITCQEQQKLIESLQKELNEIKEYLKIA